jgi:2-polyprenyl-3-methyl-5-hydroxy-6-metoxy-1,4-benzoquinol methylase
MSTLLRSITETGDTRADPDQFAMARLRHSLVARLARGGDLLDVACGAGYALPGIARHARSVTACDRDPTNLRQAQRALPAGRFVLSDAERLPLREGRFHVVACLEAIYYFADWRGFVTAAAGLLRPGGTLVVTWPNPARPAFSPSPGGTVYPDPTELAEQARAAGLEAVCYGAFPLRDLATSRRPWLDAVRRAAVRLGLIPNSLRLRMLVKRILYRRMAPLSTLTLTDDPFRDLVPITPDTAGNYTMLYLVATRKGDAPR